MLKEFKVKNFMNFRDELIFSFSNDKSYEFNGHVMTDGIIRDSVVLGYNAAGKTNLGYAILDIVNHLTDNMKTRIPNRLYTNLYSSNSVAEFSYVFQFGTHTVQYRYEKADIETVTRESLLIDDKELIRNSNEKTFVILPGAENLDVDKKGSSMSLVKYVYANTILDMGDKYASLFTEFMIFVKNMLMVASTDRRIYCGFSNKQGNIFNLICEKENGVIGLEKFLRDMGIEFKLIIREDTEGMNIFCDVDGKEVPLSALCSSGTKMLVFFYYWYIQNEDIKFLYLDEFDAFYHTDLSARVLRLLIEAKHMQVVVTSHNTDIISNEILRPDCYFILEENIVKPFYKRTSKALREAHNLQKMYKAGAFNEDI